MQSHSNNTAIRIRLFAGLREQAGWDEQLWSDPVLLNAPLTPEQLWHQLRLPGDPTLLRVAVNQHFAALDTPLHPGDELAFLPPISGG